MKTPQIPHTDSIAELARFWDTHDLTDFEDALEEVTESVFERRAEETVTIHLPIPEVEAVKRLAAFRERASRVGVEGHREFNSGWHTCIDLRNLLDCSELIAVSAIERKESRGGHFRDDYPEKAAEFGTFNIATQLVNGRAHVSRIPLQELPPELKQVIEEQKQ